MDLLNVFSFNLRKYRKLKGYSQYKLAELTGLHRTYISDLELGKRSISLTNIQKIADALGIPFYVLFLEKDGEKDNAMTIISYEQFKEKLNNSVALEDNFYYDLLIDIIKKPDRYIGIFRIADIKTRLLQDIVQSQDEKFDKFIREIITEYIEKIGYINITENIFKEDKDNILPTVKVFQKDDIIYLIGQEIRDNYNNTKKKKVFENFKKKYLLLKQKFSGNELNATLWFIDDNFKKNKRYFLSMSSSEKQLGFDMNILYGGGLFLEIFHRMDVWKEFYTYFLKLKQERSNEIPIIPDFDTSDKISEVLRKLSINEPRLYKKLISDNTKYVQIRNELFPTRQLKLYC